MIWTLLNLQLFLTQLLQDLWTTALTRTPFKDLTMQDLICGSRGPSTIRVQMKLISLLSFCTSFFPPGIHISFLYAPDLFLMHVFVLLGV